MNISDLWIALLSGFLILLAPSLVSLAFIFRCSEIKICDSHGHFIYYADNRDEIIRQAKKLLIIDFVVYLASALLFSAIYPEFIDGLVWGFMFGSCYIFLASVLLAPEVWSTLNRRL